MAAPAHQAYHTLNPVAEIPTRRYLWQKGGRHDGDRIAVYPKFEALDIRPLLRVRAQPLRNPRFVADAHLGGLARLLRMAGFDTLFDNRGHDKEIADIAARDGRIVFTRDRELLKRRNVTHGCYVHALMPARQFREIMERLDLARCTQPFSRCLECNAPLRSIDKADVLDRLPASVRDRQQRFTTCDACHRVYWKGSHWRRMRAHLAASQQRPGDCQAAKP